MGLLVVVVGIIVLVFPFSGLQHLKVYLQASNTNVRVLDCEVEELLPLAGVDPYTRNMTRGDRTLRIEAYTSNGMILQDSIDGVGEGFNLIRTSNFGRFVPWGSTIEVHVTLSDRGGLISEQTTEISAPMPISFEMGGFLLLVGILLFLPNTKRAPRKKRMKRKEH
jgi:hypothetical protein